LVVVSVLDIVLLLLVVVSVLPAVEPVLGEVVVLLLEPVVPVPAAPMEVLPVLLSVEPVAPVVALSLFMVLLLLELVLGMVPALELGVLLVVLPVDGVPALEPVPLEPALCARATPPIAIAAAAARVVRVFLVVVISTPWKRNPDAGMQVEESRQRGQLLRSIGAPRGVRSEAFQAQPVGPPLSRIAAQWNPEAGSRSASAAQPSTCRAGAAHSQPSTISSSAAQAEASAGSRRGDGTSDRGDQAMGLLLQAIQPHLRQEDRRA